MPVRFIIAFALFAALVLGCSDSAVIGVLPDCEPACDEEQPLCVAGICQQCATDEDCDNEQACEEGECEELEEPEEEDES